MASTYEDCYYWVKLYYEDLIEIAKTHEEYAWLKEALEETETYLEDK